MWLPKDSHRKICEGLRNLKSVRPTPFAQSCRFVRAALLFLCTIFPASVLYALHEVDHRFTVQGRICGDEGEGIGDSVVSVKDIRADISGKGKTDSDGFYKIVLHLHNENQGDPLVVQSGKFKATGRVELDPDDPETERIITINLGQACQAFPIWRQTWFRIGIVALFLVGGSWIIRARNRNRQTGQRKEKVRKK
jgi:hypothetical protein